MLDEATLEIVVEKVLALLAARAAADTPRRQVLALFTGAGAGYLAGMAAIHELTEANHALTVVLSPSADKLIGEEKVKAAGAKAIVGPGQWICAPAAVEKSDLIIVPTMSMNFAARLAAGLMDSLVATLILGGLLAGKPVLALRDGADPYGPGGRVFGDGKGAPVLRARMAENLETVTRYGITLVAEAQFLPTMRAFLRGEPAPGGAAAPSNDGHNVSAPAAGIRANGSRPQFITATDLLSMEPGATVRLDETCRLTPLAQDAAQRMNLKLLYG